MTIELISLILNLVLGGGLIVTVATLRSQREKAKAEADGAEIDNAQKIVNMWAELSKNRAEADAQQIGALKDLAVKRVESDEKQISALNSKIDEFENMFNSFKKTVEKLTKAINKAKECPGADGCLVLKELDNAKSE
jgi:flagellar biosynthesis chaperone FliJ